MLVLMILSMSFLPLMADVVPAVRAQSGDEVFSLPLMCVYGMTVDAERVTAYAAATSVVWSWGDGPAQNLIQDDWSNTYSHTYASADTFTITATVKYYDGKVASASQVVSVPSSSPSNCASLTITTSTGGYVTYEGLVTCGDKGGCGFGNVTSGAPVTLQMNMLADPVLAAHPNPGYSFTDWVASGSISGVSYANGCGSCYKPGTPINATSPNLEFFVDGIGSIEADFLPSTVTSVICSPSLFVVGSTAACVATVAGASPTGNVTWTSNGAGTFSPSSCTLSSGACSVSYTPSASTKPIKVTATYKGDSNNAGSSGTFPPLLSCTHASVLVGATITCRATVQRSGSPPTGTVAWSSDSPGKFSKLTCKLSKGACTVKFTPTAAGSLVILTASYAGDSNYAQSTGTYGLVVTMKTSKTTVSCKPSFVVAGSSASITCTAKVTGYSPSGTITWSWSGTGAISLDEGGSCGFGGGPTPHKSISCSVSFTVVSAGSVTIQAAYSGDSNNTGSSGTRNLKIT